MSKRKGFYIPKRFLLDRENPARQMTGETDLCYRLFSLWITGTKQSDLASAADVAESQISKLKTACCWAVRKQLIDAKAKLDQVVTREDEIKEESKFDSRTPVIRGSKLPRPPAPIKRGLKEFAEKWGPTICPGYVVDEVGEVMLDVLEGMVEGETPRVIINPPPRHTKTLNSIICLAYSLLRYPTRSQILLSANQRLSSMNNQLLKELVSNAMPEGYEISSDTSSKTAWRPGWQHAGIQVALSRGATLLGYSANILIADDLLGQVSEAEQPELLAGVMRTLQVDAQTRLTVDSYGKKPGLAILAQRLSRQDPTAQLIEKERIAEAEGLTPTPYVVCASPFLTPTKERAAEICGDYPNGWVVRQPKYTKEPGVPVSSRFTQEFATNLQASMPPSDWAVMFELDTSADTVWSAWKESYLKPLPVGEINSDAGSFIAIDMSLSGGDDSALVAGIVQDGRIVLVGLHILPPDVDEALPAIVELAKRYKCHTLGVERAAAGAYVMKSLANNIGGQVFNVIPLSHEGRNKQARQAKILGLGANDKLWIAEGLELTNVLHAQMKAVAMGKKRAKDDLSDAATYCINWLNEHWIKSGYAPTAASWAGGSGGQPGVTSVIWGRGSHALMKPTVGIDGVERYSLPGFS